jgi:LuxR family transcriptional regulator, maltose regulon positive regulatory protein
MSPRSVRSRGVSVIPYLGGGQVDTVRAWLDRLGEEAVAADPRLCLVADAGQIVVGDDREMNSWLDQAEQLPYDGPLPGGPATIEA